MTSCHKRRGLKQQKHQKQGVGGARLPPSEALGQRLLCFLQLLAIPRPRLVVTSLQLLARGSSLCLSASCRLLLRMLSLDFGPVQAHLNIYKDPAFE